MELAIIMYHYVRNVGETPFPRIHALPVGKFERHLDRLGEKYAFVGAGDVLAAVRGEARLPEHACLLTFDDGLKDHARNVFPVLRDRGIRGAFFVITSAVEEARVIDVHKVHFLLARLGTERMIEAFHDFISIHSPRLAGLSELRIDDRQRLSPSRYDDILTGNLKARLNTLDAPTKTAFLEKLFRDTLGDEAEFAKELYLSWDDVNTMIRGGMDFGSHTHSHRHIDTLSPKELGSEIATARDLLKEHTRGAALPIISDPFGTGDYSAALLDQLVGFGYALGFTVEVGVNTNLDQPLRLKRLNANDVL